jgi:hypothetical protein
MATKIINAGKILERKGIAMKQFDTGAFGAVVEEFFMNHDISATILLSPKRFIEMKEPPEGDFINFLDETIWERKSNDPNDPFDFLQLMEMQKKDLIRPLLLVNEPFIGNAAAYLRDFCGFSVKSRVRKKKKEYIVSLPV